MHVTIDPGGPLVPVDPDPGPRWYRRFRIGYNLACALVGFGICGPWAWVLLSIRDTGSLAGAWVTAIIPGAILYLLDNARQVEADHADERLIAPRIRAAVTRTLLWAAAEAATLTLPVTTLVYLITGVQPS
ncbi:MULTISPECIES: hypothetical protein [unclassified Streptomyces]|uniref:hypothetical protein n=1 Tax=unclassified Streptomyces TaxID=2593676 RepID=UPI000DDA8479|nr:MULTISPECIES: hypothetical protein [unclassified Streptomyces]QZZ26545.1 hypothetical protein A7X85_10005 [Streptomyces sp. ST1015]